MLLQKLQQNGIRGLAYNWVKSYLTDRQQFVQVGERRSRWRSITCGVPQGSVLGPILFLMYINDLCYVSPKLKFILFADDTTILYSGKNLQLLVNEITAELEKIKQWFNQNKLSLNIMKTKVMLFSKRKEDVQFQIKINKVEIERVKEYKFLGVILKTQY